MPSYARAEDFARAVRAYADKTVQLIAKEAAVTIFKEVAQNLLLTTPVLTAHARKNWVPSIGSPSTEEVEGFAAVTTTGEPMTGEEQAAINAVCDEFLKGSGTVLYYSNNVPYIQLLDDGSSKKAPGGIVEPSIQASLAVLKDKKLIT